jgi:hypothetical protein
MSVAWHLNLVQTFSYLDDASAAHVHDAVLLWMQLCVLGPSSAPGGMCAAGGDGRRQELLQELGHGTCERTRSGTRLRWKAPADPAAAAAIAQHIIDHLVIQAAEDAIVTQLNMGGERRV